MREQTLIWNGKEFRVAYEFPALFEGIGTEKPKLIQENLEQVPFIPIEDIQSGLATQSVLLAMQEQNFQPFSENTQLGENRLHFELRNNGLKTADLTSLANLDRKLNVNKHPTKVIPFLFKTQLNGQEILASSIAILNPADPQNWSPDEFIITFGIPVPNIDLQDFANFFKSDNSFLLINRIYLYATNPNLNPNDPNTIVIPNPANPQNPTLLDARDPFQSLLSQLLAIEGNDARIPRRTDNEFNLERNINGRIVQLDNQTNVIEVPIPQGSILPSQIQQMLFIFEVGTAR